MMLFHSVQLFAAMCKYLNQFLTVVKMFDVIWIMFDVILPHPASCIGELTLLLVLRSPYRGY